MCETSAYTLSPPTHTHTFAGVLKTYWANPKFKHSTESQGASSSRDSGEPEEEEAETEEEALDQAQARLVDWIVQLMSADIKKLVYARIKARVAPSNETAPPSYTPPEGSTCMDEVKEVIHMPKFDENQGHHQNGDFRKIEIDIEIIKLLGQYVSAVARHYR